MRRDAKVSPRAYRNVNTHPCCVPLDKARRGSVFLANQPFTFSLLALYTWFSVQEESEREKEGNSTLDARFPILVWKGGAPLPPFGLEDVY